MANNPSKAVKPSTNVKVETVKKAVLMGLNYIGTPNELRGCINDVENISQWLITNNFFTETQITKMTDNSKGDLYPIKANILNMFDNLVAFCKANKTKRVLLFISYSGHGSWQKDFNGDEVDGRDEVLCPLDCDTRGMILDDIIRASFIDKLGSHVNVVWVSDNCHSGSCTDVRYLYKCDANNTIMTEKKSKDTLCNIVCISGCSDVQTSADAYLPDVVTKKMEHQGALSQALITTFNENMSAKELLLKIRAYLKENGFTQIPQLTSGKKIDVNKPLLLSIYND